MNKQQNDCITIKRALEMKSYYNLHPIVPEKYHRNSLLTGTYPNQDRIIFHQCTIAQTRQRTFGLWGTSLTNARNCFRGQNKNPEKHNLKEQL